MRYFKRHHDDEIVDEIHITAIPRWKTSGMSGDEWRVSYQVQIKRKGTVLYQRHYGRIADAVAHLPWVLRTMFEGGLDGVNEQAWLDRVNTQDKDTCHQVGCANPATVIYRLKRQYAANGEGPLPEYGNDAFVSFCHTHAERGDCGREDRDDNYELVS